MFSKSQKIPLFCSVLFYYILPCFAMLCSALPCSQNIETLPLNTVTVSVSVFFKAIRCSSSSLLEGVSMDLRP